MTHTHTHIWGTCRTTSFMSCFISPYTFPHYFSTFNLRTLDPYSHIHSFLYFFCQPYCRKIVSITYGNPASLVTKTQSSCSSSTASSQHDEYNCVFFANGGAGIGCNGCAKSQVSGKEGQGRCCLRNYLDEHE